VRREAAEESTGTQGRSQPERTTLPGGALRPPADPPRPGLTRPGLTGADLTGAGLTRQAGRGRRHPRVPAGHRAPPPAG
jgi:hypothetical protein